MDGRVSLPVCQVQEEHLGPTVFLFSCLFFSFISLLSFTPGFVLSLSSAGKAPRETERQTRDFQSQTDRQEDIQEPYPWWRLPVSVVTGVSIGQWPAVPLAFVRKCWEQGHGVDGFLGVCLLIQSITESLSLNMSVCLSVPPEESWSERVMFRQY
jgi:hypothetical protein